LHLRQTHPAECPLQQFLRRYRNSIAGAVGALALALATPAAAVVVELKDVAPDRIERQRAWAQDQTLLPGTPDLTKLDARLAAKGLSKGSAIFLRIFKAEAELELWVRKGERFVLLDTYPVCHWTGSLGPKEKEGDKQSPEGFYSVTQRQARHTGRWRKALNLGFPNALDQRLLRTGSYILLHGGCSSTGCFAMTDPVIDEIHALVSAALRGGQERVHVNIFPFRMTAATLEAHKDHPWREFWGDLKAGYDAFERTRVPPRVAMCGKRYVVQDGAPGENGDRALASAPQNERGTGQCTERVAEQSQASPAAGSH
jgi:murein L,D-transpeptidase YafK